jgi:hypothetical protein
VVVEPERAHLIVPGLGAVDVLVARAVRGAAELVFLEEPPAPARMLHRRHVRITSVPPAPAGEHRAMLLAVPDSRGALRTDIVHALLHDPLDELHGTVPEDRRTGVRISVLRAVSVHHPGQVVGAQALTSDLSVGGVGLRGAVELARGDVVRLRIALEEARPVDAIGEVRRTAGLDGHGVQLVRMRPVDRLWLQRWLAAQRAAALAALSG